MEPALYKFIIIIIIIIINMAVFWSINTITSMMYL